MIDNPWICCPACATLRPNIEGATCPNAKCGAASTILSENARRKRENEHSRYLESLGTLKPR